MDPISDQFAHLSVYNYASNNPILNVDLHGLQGINHQAVWLKSEWDKYRDGVDAIKRWPTIMEGREPTYSESFMAEVEGLWSSTLGSLWSGNDVSVIFDGQHSNGDQANTVDKVLAAIFIPLPVSGAVVKKSAGALIEGTVKVFKNGDEITEKAFKFGNLGHAGTKPYRDALDAIKGGGNFVASSKDEALKLLDEALPGIPNQTGLGKQGKFGFRIDEGMSGSGVKNGHDGLHINYYDKDNSMKGTILIDKSGS